VLTNRLRHRITFQQQEHQQDSESGDEVVVWVDVVLPDGTPLTNVPAEVLTGPGREFLASRATQAEGSARINLRWFPGLDLTWRVLWGGNTYNISSAEQDATARKEWRLRCESGVTDGR
jgi:SPP1 family predicted phage head-tail adaptor